MEFVFDLPHRRLHLEKVSYWRFKSTSVEGHLKYTNSMFPLLFATLNYTEGNISVKLIRLCVTSLLAS